MEKSHKNSIGEMILGSGEVPTSSDNVYRQLRGDDAIIDIYKSGVIRSKAEAGLPYKYNDSVYWSKGKDGKGHLIGENEYVIEAPHDVAKERVVEHTDLIGIHTKRDGKVFNILDTHEEEDIQKQIEELRRKLGVIK